MISNANVAMKLAISSGLLKVLTKSRTSSGAGPSPGWRTRVILPMATDSPATKAARIL